MEKRIYLDLVIQKSIQTDAKGNYIIWAEASNENLDFQDQVVLQTALLKSKDYFLTNGIISYDHRHLQADPDDASWTPEKYIIGEPLEVTTQGKRTIIKALLYKSNPTVKNLISKLKDGSTRIKTSIAGKKPKVIKSFDEKLGRMVEKVASVLWDELAITWKPVNQTMSPVSLTPLQFVKSLSVENITTDSAQRTGGGALVTQHCQKESQKKTLKKKKQGEEKMGDELEKAFDDTIDELEKSLKTKRKKKPEEQSSFEDEDQDDEFDDEKDSADSEDEDHEDDESEEDSRVAARSRKSFSQVFEENGGKEYLDVSGFLKTFVKSMSETLDGYGVEIASIKAQQTSIAKSILAEARFLKSLSGAPVQRQAQISRIERTFAGSGEGKSTTLDRREILNKALSARLAGKMSSLDFTKLEMRLAKGILPDESLMTFLKAM